MADKVIRIALVGNTNVGKSVVFGRLTGSYAVVSNYPGTTVDVSRGTLELHGKYFEVIDTPGTISLLPSSEDEQVSRDILFSSADIIVQIADAKNLVRSLLLSSELMELGLPMVLVLNMADEAKDRGIRIDRDLLSKELGISVVETVATTGFGISELKKKIVSAKVPISPKIFSSNIEHGISSICDKDSDQKACKPIATQLLAGQSDAIKYFNNDNLKVVAESVEKLNKEVPAAEFSYELFKARNDFALSIVSRVQQNIKSPASSFLSKVGSLSMSPYFGYFIVFFVLFVMYKFVGQFGAGFLVNLLEKKVFAVYVNPFFINLINYLSLPQIIKDLFIGKFGIITMALTYAFAIIMPIVATFFLFFGVLEDSGYLPRLSLMLDKLMKFVGLNGKAVLPMMLGLGCGTMATLTSRILETKRERFLVILLLALGVPCSAQLGVVLGLLAGLSFKVTAIWFMSVFSSLVFVGLLANKLVPGKPSPFILEVPPLRMPMISNILIKVYMRMLWYLKEAVPLFILGTVILFTLDKIGALLVLQKLASPVIVGFLGLPAETTGNFIMGFLRRDYGAAGFFIMAKNGLLTHTQIVVSAVIITLFLPCIAQFFVTVREKGWKMALSIMLFVFAYAITFGGALNFALKLLH